jgi:hypothetical protein
VSVENDSDFLKVFVWVLGSLVVFTFFILFMANMFSPNSASEQDPLVVEQTKNRIMPIGMSRLAQ